MAKLCYENEGKQVISEHLTCDKGTYRKRYGRQNKTKQIRNMILKFTLAVVSHIYVVGLVFSRTKADLTLYEFRICIYISWYTIVPQKYLLQ